MMDQYSLQRNITAFPYGRSSSGEDADGLLLIRVKNMSVKQSPVRGPGSSVMLLRLTSFLPLSLLVEM